MTIHLMNSKSKLYSSKIKGLKNIPELFIKVRFRRQFCHFSHLALEVSSANSMFAIYNSQLRHKTTKAEITRWHNLRDGRYDSKYLNDA